MAALFIAEALDQPLSIGQQISLPLLMIIASKDAAGVTGAGLATLAGGLQSHRPDLVDGVGLIVGIEESRLAPTAMPDRIPDTPRRGAVPPRTPPPRTAEKSITGQPS